MKKLGLVGLAIASFVVPAAFVVALVVVRAFVIDIFHIPQNGMYPGLPAGSRFMTWRRPYESISEVRRGDVIVFERTLKGDLYVFIWRVIALPGDVVEVSGETVIVNGDTLDAVFLHKEDGHEIFRETNAGVSYEVAYTPSGTREPPSASLTVPADHLFVLGDNRDDARDSRYDGTVPFSTVIGRAIE